MLDLYSKVVLTVIAVALSAIAYSEFAQPAFAIGDACGSRFDPCYVEVSEAIEVRGYVGINGIVEAEVTNWP